MKKIKLLMCTGAIIVSSLAVGQIQEGSKFVGGAFQISSSGSKSKSGVISVEGDKTTSFTLLPQVGYMVSDQLAVGIGAGISTQKIKDPSNSNIFTSSSTIIVSPFARYYIKAEEKFGIFGQFSLPIGFGKAETSYETTEYVDEYDDDGYWIGTNLVTTTEVSDYKTSTFSPTLGVGFTFFPTESLALEGTLNVLGMSSGKNKYTGGEYSYSNMDFGVNFNSINWSVIYFF